MHGDCSELKQERNDAGDDDATYVVCWWSLRQDGNSVERWNRMELRMMVALYACWRAGHLSALAVRQAKNLELTESRIEKELWICEAVIPSSSVLQTG